MVIEQVRAGPGRMIRIVENVGANTGLATDFEQGLARINATGSGRRRW